MADLVSLKRTPTERKKDSDIMTDVGDGSFFPLSLHVSDTEVEKLGLGDAQVGDEMMLMAMVKVTSVSMSERENDKKREHVTLTLQEGKTASSKQVSSAKKLFGDSTKASDD